MHGIQSHCGDGGTHAIGAKALQSGMKCQARGEHISLPRERGSVHGSSFLAKEGLSL